MRMVFRLISFGLIACSSVATVTIDGALDPCNPIETMGMGSIVGPGLQGSGTQAAPLDIKAGSKAGDAPTYNGTSYTMSQHCGDPSKIECITDDMITAASNCSTVGTVMGFVGQAVGTGAGCSTTSFAGHPSVTVLATGTTTTGGFRYSTNVASYALGGGDGEQCTYALLQVPTLSTSTDEYSLRVGFGTFATIGVDPGDGVFVVYDRATTGSDVWGAKACAASSCSSLLKFDGTGGTVITPVVAGNWIRFDVCAASNGSSVAIKTGCPSACTTVGTLSSNIPLVSNNRRVGIGLTGIKSAGTTGRVVNIDFQGRALPFSLAR